MIDYGILQSRERGIEPAVLSSTSSERDAPPLNIFLLLLNHDFPFWGCAIGQPIPRLR
jgi:hypothetical protein